MAWETREGQGSAFRNRRKESPTHPDFTGEAMLDGKLYWLSIWEKKDKNGNPWLSLALKVKDGKNPGKPGGKLEDDSDRPPF